MARLGGSTRVRRGLGGADASALADAGADATAEAEAEADAEAFFGAAAVLLFTAISFSRSLTFFSSSLTRAADSAICFSLAILSSTATPVLPAAGTLAVDLDSFSLSLASL